MDASVYSTAAWRDLPRERCVVADLFGDAVGPCHGLVHRHHVDPDDPLSRTVECCARHHPSLQAALRALLRPHEWKRCRKHRHPYPQGREACERRLNGVGRGRRRKRLTASAY